MANKNMGYIPYLVLSLFFLLTIGFASTHGEEEFSRAEEIIKSKISCGQLGGEELEVIGDYYMEQMHPGKLHELMDERMGGEGSESLGLAHIAIARAFYCGEQGMMSPGMMNNIMGRNNGYGIGMMNYYNYFNLTNILINILLVLLIALLVFCIIKLAKKKK